MKQEIETIYLEKLNKRFKLPKPVKIDDEVLQMEATDVFMYIICKLFFEEVENEN